MLRSSYQLYTWYVYIETKGKNYSFKCRLDGFGKKAESKNDPECTHNMLVYGVATYKLRDRKGECTDEDEEKVQKIVEDVVWSDMCGDNSNYSVDRVAEEVESRLNRDSLHWLVIQVRESGTSGGCFDWSDDSNVCCVPGCSDKYFIGVFLSN